MKTSALSSAARLLLFALLIRATTATSQPTNAPIPTASGAQPAYPDGLIQAALAFKSADIYSRFAQGTNLAQILPKCPVQSMRGQFISYDFSRPSYIPHPDEVLRLLGNPITVKAFSPESHFYTYFMGTIGRFASGLMTVQFQKDYVVRPTYSIQTRLDEVPVTEVPPSEAKIPDDPTAKRLIGDVQHQTLGEVKCDRLGNVVSLTLPSPYCDDQSLAALSNLPSLREVKIDLKPHGSIPTAHAISRLGQLTNLVSFGFYGFGELSPGLLTAATKLKGLQRLHLVSAAAPSTEYTSLTNLRALQVLYIAYCTNFGDAQLPLVTNLNELAVLHLDYNAITPTGYEAFEPAISSRVKDRSFFSEK